MLKVFLPPPFEQPKEKENTANKPAIKQHVSYWMLSLKKSQFKLQSCNSIDHQPNKGRCQRPNNALHESTYYRIHILKTKKAGIGSGLILPIPAINY
jgi:hypothetical protein